MESTSQTESTSASSDSILMDRSLYEAAMKGKTHVLGQNRHELDVKVSPENNTVLHIAAQFGNLECVKYILRMNPMIFDRLNSKGEIPIYIAAREGEYDIVKVLIEHAKEQEQHGNVGAAKKMRMLTNNDKETALHEAMRNSFAYKLVELLTQEVPELSCMANNADETPLYLAAEGGNDRFVFLILKKCTEPAYGGPLGRTALHAAVVHDSEECTKLLLNWKQDLLKKADENGWSPLHHAARYGTVSMVRLLLNKDKSVAYLVANEDGRTTALHIATARGHVDIMKVLIYWCPGCWEVNNSRGQNILHIAVQSKKEKAIKFILETLPLRSLINEKDTDGNTALHLLVASNCYVPKLVRNSKSHRNAFNKKNHTPMDIALCNNIKLTNRDFFKDLIKVGAAEGRRDITICNEDHEIAANANNEDDRIVRKDIRKTADTHLIVAALLATVTFAAGFTVPGGYDGNRGPDQGMAILTRKVAFKLFAISDTIAMILSTCAVFIHFIAADYEDKCLLKLHYKRARDFITFAMGAAVLAFITGMFSVLSLSRGLAIAECAVGCLSLPIVIFHSETYSE